MPLDRNEPKFGPTYLSVNLRPADRLMETTKHKDGLLIDRLRPTNQLLTTRTGNVTHKFELDGSAAICVRSQGASEERPLRVGLAIVENDGIEVPGGMVDPLKVGGNQTGSVASHLSFMVMEVKRIGFAMKNVLSEADFAKERDSIFHRQAQDMDQATIFWPIVQVCVLLMTGFAQASHIVWFFKSRRII
jgi:emp24/gp25L/p24 family/GOLD